MKNKEFQPKIGFIGEDRQTILEDLNFAVKNGFSCYEIQGRGEKIDLEPKIIEQTRKIARENDIFLSLHAFHLPISTSNPAISKQAFRAAKEEIILANKVGATQITIHSGHKDRPDDKEAVAKNFEIFQKNFAELVEFGRKYEIKIGLENSPKNRAICVGVKDLLKAVNSIEGLKITLDVGHANTAEADPVNYLRQVKDFLINVHIHDNDGSDDQHALIGEGNIDFEGLFRECKNSGFYGPFVLEVFPHENVLKGREIFLNIWNKI